MASVITGGVSILFFASLVNISYSNYDFCSRNKNLCKNCKNQNYKPIIKKKNKKHDKIAFLGKTKLRRMGVLISKDLIDSVEFASVNNVFRLYDDIKDEIKNLKNSTVHQRF